MRVRPEQLDGHLKERLRPIYLVSGDEPLQVQEAADAIRAAARAQGYSEREVLHVEAGFDWGRLLAAAQSLSLFAERRILDLRVPGKLGDAGTKALAEYAAAAPEDNLLLITMGKLEGRQQQSKWFGALDKVGAVVQVWPVEHGQLPGWISRRMRSRGLNATPEAVQLLAERVEGNLLAAVQEIEKLRLLYGEGGLDADQVAAAVADSARYNTFELLEAALGGDGARVTRILGGLRGEGEEPLAILGLFMWEVRNLSAMASDAADMGLEAAIGKHRVWEKRKPLVRAALQRHRQPARWGRLLAHGARIDRMVKGAEPGNPWDELLSLALFIAGVRVV